MDKWEEEEQDLYIYLYTILQSIILCTYHSPGEPEQIQVARATPKQAATTSNTWHYYHWRCTNVVAC